MKLTRIFLLLAASMAVLVACNDQPQSTSDAPVEPAQLAEAGRLIQMYCVSCHAPHGNSEDRIAPPMLAIKNHYYENGMSREDFVKSFTEFVLNPTEETSKMPGALEKFGLMPKLGMEQTQLETIAGALFDQDIQDAGWLDQWIAAVSGQPASKEELTEVQRGKRVAMSTKAILGKNLLGAISERGTANAVEFCNERAIFLTDSMSADQHVPVKRVSDQPRNPGNLANATELEYIAYAKSKLAEGQEPAPKVHNIDGRAIGYYPIVTNKMCMQCHGAPETQILAETMHRIDSLYPQDLAKGYGENELRGIWVVEIPGE
ncbi:MAG: DUF3365 domain-containing protein [Flavobacteriales bacterium]|nr:DUF3365 domain-containing protein [Flavobacteriales bacterium]